MSKQTDPEDLSIDLTEATDMAAWAALSVAQLKRDMAARDGQHRLLGDAYAEMAALSSVPALRRTYRLRAAQALEQADDDPERIRGLLQRNLAEAPADSHSSTTGQCQ